MICNILYQNIFDAKCDDFYTSFVSRRCRTDLLPFLNRVTLRSFVVNSTFVWLESVVGPQARGGGLHAAASGLRVLPSVLTTDRPQSSVGLWARWSPTAPRAISRGANLGQTAGGGGNDYLCICIERRANTINHAVSGGGGQFQANRPGTTTPGDAIGGGGAPISSPPPYHNIFFSFRFQIRLKFRQELQWLVFVIRENLRLKLQMDPVVNLTWSLPYDDL